MPEDYDSWRTWEGRQVFALVVIVLMASAVGLTLPRAFPALGTLELWAFDLRVAVLTRPSPTRGDIAVITVTEDTLAQYAYRSPIDRGALARVMNILSEIDVRAIGLDVFIDQSTDPSKDMALDRAVTDSQRPVIVAWGKERDGLTERQVSHLRDFIARTRARPGFVSLPVDQDGTVRRFPSPGKDYDSALSFAAAIAEEVDVSVPREMTFIAYSGQPQDGTDPFLTLPMHLLENFWKTQPQLVRRWFANRIVLIGADLPHQDRYRTPFTLGRGQGELTPGVFIHAYVLAQMIDGQELPLAGLASESVIILLLVVCGVCLLSWNVRLPFRLGGGALALFAFWTGGFALYHFSGPLIPLVSPTLGFLAATTVTAIHREHRFANEKKFIRTALARYVSPRIATRLERNPSSLRLGGEVREMTFVFTDIAEFSHLAEQLESEQLVSLLNEYFEGMSAVVLHFEGTIDKFIGDGMVAFFGAPSSQPDHAERAISCALELHAFAERFANEKAQIDIALGDTRIGIHTGQAIVGNCGGSSRFDYTVIGDAVNVAARLEQANKTFGTKLCVSGMTVDQCSDKLFRPIGDLILKGRNEAVPAFELLDGDLTHTDVATKAYRDAYDLMRNGSPAAKNAFKKIVETNPDDGLAAFHFARLSRSERGVTIAMEVSP